MGLGAKGFGVLRSRMVKLENQLHKEQEEAKKKEAAEKAATNSIRKMIKNLKLTAEAAMEALEIPKSDYPKYMAML